MTRFGDVIRGDCIGVVVANGVRMSVGGGVSGTSEGTVMRGGGGACSSSGSSGYLKGLLPAPWNYPRSLG